MDRNKSQILLLDKSELETVAKALSSGCWTLSDSGHIEISDGSTTSGVCGNSPKLTLAQGNVRPVTQASGAGGSANIKRPVSSEPLNLQRDNSHMTTLTELGKKLIEAARVGDTSQVRRLMAIGAPFASDGPIGMNPLHLASQNGHYETCERLLSAGMNKDARNKVDKTPLHLAAMEGHTDIVHLLIKSGANLNACDMLKMTALHWACDRGHTSIVRLLLQHQAQTDIANKFFKTPLHLAVGNRHDNIVVLLQGKISPKTENEDEEEQEETEEDDDDDDDGGKEPRQAKAPVFGFPSSSLSDIPVVCKTEEVHTEFIEEVCESSDPVIEDEEEIPTEESELPHSIMDDLEDQNISVLASLAELAQATKSSDHSVDMSNAAALELLKAQAALLPLDDSSTLVTSAVAHGQTLHLTEAGRQALKLIKQELPLFPTSTLPKEKNQEEESTASEKTGGSTTIKKEHSLPTTPIALPPPPPRPPPPSLLSSVSSSSTPTSLLSPSSSSTSSSLLSVSSLSSLPSSSTLLTSPSSLSVSCLPTLLASQTDEGKEEEQVTQVITLTAEQYAALTNGGSGPVILQVLPSDGTEEAICEANINTSPSPCKRQKIMQLVTKFHGSSDQQLIMAKISGKVQLGRISPLLFSLRDPRAVIEDYNSILVVYR
ncbi:poly [ADP-ribose] polymerase tankyrase-2-like isoform X2 [Portunus trituberculatus]|uniref:poly [ADP-ribose] polymerase tankyrase-2-like isoform X2 n=1 Tax=Portunus trituberculatus TaxID=210409 RepID=UPI001E1D128D|nr:poly [ADP-ribose] polymerase tankyrase-2-like isoform X2 [Portunus trituberculatus]